MLAPLAPRGTVSQPVAWWFHASPHPASLAF